MVAECDTRRPDEVKDTTVVQSGQPESEVVVEIGVAREAEVDIVLVVEIVDKFCGLLTLIKSITE